VLERSGSILGSVIKSSQMKFEKKLTHTDIWWEMLLTEGTLHRTEYPTKGITLGAGDDTVL
jgi:hypothetical protein